MRWTNSKKGYGFLARLLHWVSALMMLTQLSLGFYMVMLSGAEKSKMYAYHKTYGLIILGVILIRVSWALMSKKPDYPNMPHWQILAAKAMHVLLYGLMLVIPVTGWIMSTLANYPPDLPLVGKVAFPITEGAVCFSENCYMISSLSHDLHVYLGYVMVVLIVFHVMVAIKHFCFSDGIFDRMIIDQT